MIKLSIVIPAFNEAKNLEVLVKTLCEAFSKVEPSFELILVDNGSTDDTESVLARLRPDFTALRTVRVFPNRGYGRGILAGLEAARGEIVGWMHADLQIKPEDAVRTYEACLAAGHDGMRMGKVVRVSRDEPRWRLVQSKVYNTIFRSLFKTDCRDINGSPKFFSRGLYERAKLESNDWFLDPEIMIASIRLGAKVAEVPIVWDARSGKSKVSVLTSLEFMRNLVRSAVRKR